MNDKDLGRLAEVIPPKNIRRIAIVYMGIQSEEVDGLHKAARGNVWEFIFNVLYRWRKRKMEHAREVKIFEYYNNINTQGYCNNSTLSTPCLFNPIVLLSDKTVYVWLIFGRYNIRNTIHSDQCLNIKAIGKF